MDKLQEFTLPAGAVLRCQACWENIKGPAPYLSIELEGATEIHYHASCRQAAIAQVVRFYREGSVALSAACEERTRRRAEDPSLDPRAGLDTILDGLGMLASCRRILEAFEIPADILEVTS